MIKPQSVFFLLAFSRAAVAGDAKSSMSSGGDWEFSISSGPAWRQSGSVGFTGGSLSAGIPIPSFVGNNSLITPDIGTLDAYGLRTYNDGFVGTDSSTSIDGLTSFLGYQNSSQIDLSGDRLLFHATGFQSIRSDDRRLLDAPRENDPQRGLAPVIQFDARYKQEIAGFQPGFSMLFAWSPVNFDSQWSDFSLNQTRDDFRHDWTDSFNLGGLGAFIPTAPYTGAPDSPGLLLENIPDSRDMIATLIGSENALISNQIDTRFSAEHTSLSFGPTIVRRLNPEWNVEAGAGVALHWLRYSASQQEKLSVLSNGTSNLLGEWRSSSSGNRILGGLYLQLAVEWAPQTEDWSLKAMLRSDVGDSFSKNIGPSKISYDTNGYTAGVMISQKF